jgi:carbon monoxide dehydrogenase subunit G
MREHLPPQGTTGTVRHHRVIHAPAERVWGRIADAAHIASWFPGMSASSMSTDEPWVRTVVTQTGLPLVEDIVNVDDALRRFEYRLRPNALIRDHHGVIDVFPLDAGSCLVSYATAVNPRIFAIAIASGTLHALDELARQCEATAETRSSP